MEKVIARRLENTKRIKMIEAKELRIGSLVQNAKNNYKYVSLISTKSVNIRNNDKDIDIIVDLEELRPIPITEEWLLKFGFEKDGFGNYNISINYFNEGYKVISFTRDLEYSYIVEGMNKGHKNNDIITIYNKDKQKEMFVHQLQNLYFALTGEELKEI